MITEPQAATLAQFFDIGVSTLYAWEVQTPGVLENMWRWYEYEANRDTATLAHA